MKNRRLLLYVILVMILALMPVGTRHILWPHFLLQNEPLHSTIEAVGAVAAILMAILLLQRQPDEGGRRLFWVAIGLLGGGILDGFHATSQPGQGFVLLHSTAVLVSGFGFALVWLPETYRHTFTRRWIPWVVIIGAALFGIWTFLFRETLPVMVQDGEFTTIARALNLLSGVFFVIAGGRFLVDFHRSSKLEPYLFSCMALLFGLSSLTFTYSALWDDTWWFWHLVRLSAYLLVMGFVIHRYRQTALSLRGEITERKLAEERIIHFTAVLRAIRNVNQLITREKDRQNLIQQSCDLLVQRRGYEKAWVLLLDENRNFVTVASTGLGENAPTFLKQLETGNYPICLSELLAQEQSFIAYDQPGKRHEGCILAGEHSRQGVFRCKLEHEGEFYGILGVALPSGAVSDKDEQDLFHELCGDIAFALANIERDEKRQQVEAALRKSEERYHTTLNSMLEGCQIIDFDWRYIYLNDAAIKHGRQSREELLGRTMMETYPGIENTEMFAHLQQSMEKRIPHRMENLFTFPDGSQGWFELSIEPIPEGIFILSQDITERKRAEEQIEQSAREWQTTFDSISDWVSVHGKDFRIIRVNRAFADFLKMKPEEIIGRHCYELIHGENEASRYCAHKEALETGKPVYKEFFNPYLGIYMEVVCAPIFDERGEITTTAHIGRDITKRKKMEAQMMVTDRLASIGELASGIAHELNNPLTGVIGFSELLLGKDVPDDVKEDLMVINREAKRAAQVVRNLLTFARKHPQEKQAVNINNTIKLVLELRAYEQKLNNIEVNTHLAADLPEVMADSFQLQQVFLNIIINAEYFMVEALKRGTLTITTERVGDIVRAFLADDGPGIAPENLERIFDPFFTTKEVGKGTGLGLSICHGIVTGHGGRIYAESELDKGATFVIELPISQ